MIGNGSERAARWWATHRFELPQAEGWARWAWVFLAAVIAVPVIIRAPIAPFGTYEWPLVERAVPIMWLCVAGLLVGSARIAKASWPFAAILVWSGIRAAYHGFPVRSLQVLALMLLAGFLYVAAREMPDGIARWVAWAFVAGACYEALLGALNAGGIYPGMAWVAPEHFGKPMGVLTHPNYWGSWMALSLPLVWALLGAPAAALVYLLTLKTVSAGPVLTASVAAVVMAWPLIGRRVRWALAGVVATASAAILTLHEWRLSGRREIWEQAWPEISRWLFLGQGIGQWRVWADDRNLVGFKPWEGKNFLVTLQAHNEPYQFLFELGLIGVVLGACLLLQAGLAAWLVWQAAPTGRLPGRWLRWGRAPLERAWVAVLAAAAVNMLGSPTFHLPAQAALVLFALARVQADAEAFHRVGPLLRAVAARRREHAATSY